MKVNYNLWMKKIYHEKKINLTLKINKYIINNIIIE